MPRSKKVEELCRMIYEFAKRNDEDALSIWERVGSFVEAAGGNRENVKDSNWLPMLESTSHHPRLHDFACLSPTLRKHS